MAVKRTFPDGTRIHGGPYSERELHDFYRRVNAGPVTVVRAAPNSGAPVHETVMTDSGAADLSPRAEKIKDRIFVLVTKECGIKE